MTMSQIYSQMSVSDSFSTVEAARLSGLSTDMINYLARHKLVIASGSPKGGRGKGRKYLFADLVLLRAVKQMLDRGISVLKLKKGLASFRRRGGSSLNELICRKYLVTDGYNIFFEDASNSIEAIESGQLAFAFVLELSSIRATIEGDAARLKKVAHGQVAVRRA